MKRLKKGSIAEAWKYALQITGIIKTFPKRNTVVKKIVAYFIVTSAIVRIRTTYAHRNTEKTVR